MAQQTSSTRILKKASRFAMMQTHRMGLEYIWDFSARGSPLHALPQLLFQQAAFSCALAAESSMPLNGYILSNTQ